MALTINDVVGSTFKYIMSCLVETLPDIDPYSVVISHEPLNQGIYFNFYNNKEKFFIPIYGNMDIRDFPEYFYTYIKKLNDILVSDC